MQAKLAAWLSWSQPFIHQLVAALDDHVRNVVLCSQTENLDRYPVQQLCRVSPYALLRPRRAVATANWLREKHQPDLIHAHFGWTGIRLVLLKQLLRVPLVVTFGGRDLGMQLGLPELRTSYRTLLDAADRILCVSRDLAERAVAAGADPSRVEVLYRGVDLERFRLARREARPPGRPLRLLMVGRLVEKKGTANALAALRVLVERGLAVELRLVGEGEQLRALRALARKLGVAAHVQFVGSVPHARVLEELRAADVLVHCSITPRSGDVEGIPNALVEAQATGLPVVATLHGGIPEVVLHGQTGLLVAEGDVPALAAALDGLARDAGLREALGTAGRRRMERHFDFRRQVERHVELYSELSARCARDAEWQSRNWLPREFAHCGRSLLGSTSHPGEFSLGELTRAAFADDLGPVERPSEGGAHLLERLYEQKRHIPPGLKYSVKRALGAVLAAVIRHRSGSDEPLDREIVERLRSGAKLRELVAALPQGASPDPRSELQA